MDIQSDIKQPHFKSPKQKVQVNLIYTFNHFNILTRNLFKKHNMLYQHFNILKILKGAGGKAMCNNEILGVMLDKNSDLTRLVSKLEGMGFVTKVVNPINKRSVLIKLTKAGLSFTLDVESEIEDWIEENTNLTYEECDQLSALLDKIRRS
jgi:DNA-binding MarR family transcriptional regulator